MKKMIIRLLFLVALVAASTVPSFAQGGQNVTMNITLNTTDLNTTNLNTTNISVTNFVNTSNLTNKAIKPELRVGFESVKPVSNLDRFGTKPVYDIEAYSQNKLLYNASNASQAQLMFNVSQRSGTTPTIVYRTGETKPMYIVSASPEQPVYNIDGYSPIKVNSPTP